MNDAMQTQIATILEKAQDNVGQAVDFAMTQAPLLVQEILNWEIYSSVFFMGICAIIMFIGLMAVRPKVWKWASTPDCFCRSDRVSILVPITGCCAVVGSSAPFFVNCYDLIKVLVAPRIYLIEYFTGLIN
jgi:hypothetical protein